LSTVRQLAGDQGSSAIFCEQHQARYFHHPHNLRRDPEEQSEGTAKIYITTQKDCPGGIASSVIGPVGYVPPSLSVSLIYF